MMNLMMKWMMKKKSEKNRGPQQNFYPLATVAGWICRLELRAGVAGWSRGLESRAGVAGWGSELG